MDKEIIIKRLSYMKEKLKDIEYNFNKYEKVKNSNSAKIIQAALERWSEEIVESAINVNNELLEDINEFSKSYYDSFIQLEKISIFSKEELEKLASTSGFRNRLAHDYMELDKKITLESIKKILFLYKNYIIKVTNYIE